MFAVVAIQTCTKGSNSGIFKIVSFDIGMIGMQGKATETWKAVILTTTKKQTNKKKKHYQITFEKKVLC